MDEQELAEMRRKVDYIERVFHVSEIVDIEVRPELSSPVCPDCVDHPQADSDDVLDCKNLFLNTDGSVQGQCCCWSIVHGKREPWPHEVE